jgi:phosphatidylglycerol:prolipoprotein diacylglycerol transferase
MGQWLSIPLILIGLFFVVRALMRPPLASGAKAIEAPPEPEAIEAKPAGE